MTSPRARAARRPVAGGVTFDIDEQTVVGEVYLRTLMRAQLRLALVVLAGVGLVLGGLPLLFLVIPEARTLRVAGVPLPWLVLGGGVYPVLVAAAALHIRASERAEREFVELVRRT
ncbi:MAG: hypothetical protein M3Q27_07430 [Actinomycetota bacterium]|nr:hypothetical protein [Actinomycetota bacterium]